MLCHGAPALFEAAEEEVLRKLADFKPEETVSVLMAHGRIGYPAHRLFEAVAQRSSGSLEQYGAQVGCALGHARMLFSRACWQQSISRSVDGRILYPNYLSGPCGG